MIYTTILGMFLVFSATDEAVSVGDHQAENAPAAQVCLVDEGIDGVEASVELNGHAATEGAVQSVPASAAANSWEEDTECDDEASNAASYESAAAAPTWQVPNTTVCCDFHGYCDIYSNSCPAGTTEVECPCIRE